MRILVVEDEEELNRDICDFLQEENYQCDGATTHFKAEDLLLINSYELIVLDINLPDGNGLDLLKWMKEEGIESAVLILSARDSLDHKIEGLDLGADDYLTKPFHLAELNARVKALIRRKNFGGNANVVFNELELKTESKQVLVNGVQIELTPRQYDILEFFISNKEKVISKEHIARHLWGSEAVEDYNIEFIYNHVKNIRLAIHKAGGNNYIHTVYGLGYRFSEA